MAAARSSRRCTDRFKNGDGVATGTRPVTTLQKLRAKSAANIIETEGAFHHANGDLHSTFGPLRRCPIDFAAHIQGCSFLAIVPTEGAQPDQGGNR